MHHLPEPEDLSSFQFGILILSVALLGALAIELFLPLPAEVSRLVIFVDTTICLLLFVDWLVRFGDAKSKARFMRWGWIDLLACIPTIQAFRVLRVFRIVRLLLAVRTFNRFRKVLAKSKTSAGLSGIVVVAIIVTSFGSAGMILAEHNSPEANITTAEDALWWALVTITTVGYGEHFPVTGPGRIIAAVLMVTGIGLFGTLSGVAAGFFLGGKKEQPASLRVQQRILGNLDEMRSELGKLRPDQGNPPPPDEKLPPD